MKKMKKLFSKITVLVLLVAMLVPYTSIPKVEAEVTCDTEWEYHTNYYFFLQAEHPRNWAHMLATDSEGKFATDDNTATTYYTSFLYNFPSDGSTLDITDAGFVELDKNGGTGDVDSTDEWSVKGFYNELAKMGDGEDAYDYSNPDSIYKQYSYNVKGSGKTETDRQISYFIHGPWAFVGLDDDLNNYDPIIQDKEGIVSLDSYRDANNDSGASTDEMIKALTEASVIPQSNRISRINIGIQPLSLGSNNSAINNIESAIEDFNEDKGEKTKEGIYKTEKSGETVLRLYIMRSYDTSDFFESSVDGIRMQSGGVYMNTNLDKQKASDPAANDSVDELTPDYKLYFPEIDRNASNTTACDTDRDDCNSEAYVTQGASTDKVSKPTAVKLEAEKGAEYWFLAPSLFQISYKVCKAPAAAEAGKVTISYNGNAEGATNVPKTDTINSGETYTVSTQEPTLSGSTFKNWSTSQKCDNNFFEPGAKLENLTNNTTLFACWGSTGTTPTKPTGVLTYAGLFTGIIALAGGSYYLIKKKNLFKKI